MKETERHILRWDCAVLRNFNPVYDVLGGRYDMEPLPPVDVQVSATFDNNEAALAFERAVRELLEKS